MVVQVAVGNDVEILASWDRIMVMAITCVSLMVRMQKHRESAQLGIQNDDFTGRGTATSN